MNRGCTFFQVYVAWLWVITVLVSFCALCIVVVVPGVVVAPGGVIG